MGSDITGCEVAVGTAVGSGTDVGVAGCGVGADACVGGSTSSLSEHEENTKRDKVSNKAAVGSVLKQGSLFTRSAANFDIAE